MHDGRNLWATGNGREWAPQQPVPWGSESSVTAMTAAGDALWAVASNSKIWRDVLWRMDRDQSWTQAAVADMFQRSSPPGLAPYGSGVLLVGDAGGGHGHAVRYVPPLAGEGRCA